MSAEVPVITIDGPAGVGKGTIARELANLFTFHYLDSGATYRALAFQVLDDSIDISRIDKIVEAAQHLSLEFTIEKGFMAHANGLNIDEKLRSEECSAVASKIASIPEIRTALLVVPMKTFRLSGLNVISET